MTDERSRNALTVAQRHADGEATDQELAAARTAAGAAAGAAVWDAAWAAARTAAWAAPGDAAWAAARDAQKIMLRRVFECTSMDVACDLLHAEIKATRSTTARTRFRPKW
jgi:hypothetical protein